MNTGPIARATDPITSHEAGAAITASGVRGTQQQAVLAAVQAQPGRTSAELAASSTLNRYTVARRLPELERLGEVIRGAVRECTASRLRAGRAVTWWPAAASVVEVESVAWDGPEGRLF